MSRSPSSQRLRRASEGAADLASCFVERLRGNDRVTRSAGFNEGPLASNDADNSTNNRPEVVLLVASNHVQKVQHCTTQWYTTQFVSQGGMSSKKLLDLFNVSILERI